MLKYQALYAIQANAEDVNEEAKESVMRQMKDIYKLPPAYIRERLGNRVKVMKDFKVSLVKKQDHGGNKRPPQLENQKRMSGSLANNEELAGMLAKLSHMRRLLPTAFKVNKQQHGKRFNAFTFNMQFKKCARDLVQYRLENVAVDHNNQILDFAPFKPNFHPLSKDFFGAVKRDNKSLVQRLVQHNRQLLFALNDFGQTALHVAAKRGLDSIAAFLILEKGPINLLNSNRQRPIDIAVQTQNLDLAKVITFHNSFCWRLDVILGALT